MKFGRSRAEEAVTTIDGTVSASRECATETNARCFTDLACATRRPWLSQRGAQEPKEESKTKTKTK